MALAQPWEFVGWQAPPEPPPPEEQAAVLAQPLAEGPYEALAEPLPTGAEASALPEGPPPEPAPSDAASAGAAPGDAAAPGAAASASEGGAAGTSPYGLRTLSVEDARAQLAADAGEAPAKDPQPS